jgi:disulfide bond formation protein DsbB
MIFKGSGDCTKIDWTFLGGSIANWSFAVFMSIFFLMIFLRLRDGLLRTSPNLEALEPLS